jgi:hypothetical protein
LFGDLGVLFPVFATGLSEFNLVAGNEEIFLFACRVEWNSVIWQFFGLPKLCILYKESREYANSLNLPIIQAFQIMALRTSL